MKVVRALAGGTSWDEWNGAGGRDRTADLSLTKRLHYRCATSANGWLTGNAGSVHKRDVRTDHEQNLRTVSKAYRLKLYPSEAQAKRLAQVAGSCRWLWNQFLALQNETYKREKRFVFRLDMQKLLPGLKLEFPWLADSPSQTLQYVCLTMDRALKASFSKKSLFPRPKVRGVSRESFYVSNQALGLSGNRAFLPKIGEVRFRGGRMPEGKVMGATVSFDGDAWWLSVQCDLEIEIPAVPVVPETAIGVDLGLRDLAVVSDGRRFKAPKHLRHALRRLRRAQRRLARRERGSANRLKAKAEVRRLNRQVANRRSDHAHKMTRELVDGASMIAMETLNVQGMSKVRHLSMSINDASWGRIANQIAYKAEWAGVAVVRAGRFEASTQTCSCCGERKTGEAKLTLNDRTFRCDGCGHEADRDLNAAQTLRRIGLARIGDAIEPIEISNVGQALPERGGRRPPDARGDPSAGPALRSDGRRGSPKREPLTRKATVGRSTLKVERAIGIEPTTSSLATKCSPTELRPRAGKLEGAVGFEPTT